MLPSSVRRVATIACQSSSPILSSFSATSPSAAAASTFGLCVAARRQAGTCSHPRYSSSKPSSSDNGPKKVAADDSSVTPAVERESKSTGEKRKRKSRTTKTPAKDLPSVPSTSHLSQQTIALTSFFSLHRPISVTDGFPATVSNDAFASIFDTKNGSTTSEVISALSDTVDQLEQPMTKVVISAKDGGAAGEQQVQIFQQMENALPNLFDQLNAMSGKFSPFTSPPTPKLEGAEGAADTKGSKEARRAASMARALEAADAAEAAQGDQHVQYKAVITIDQTTKPDGRVEMVAHSPEILMDGDEAEWDRRRRMRRCISVKRIRKLKMKKKKYKKLMRRTRNERRKLDRL